MPGSAAASDSKTGASHPASTGGGGGGGVADALAQALSARNKKVSVSGMFCILFSLFCKVGWVGWCFDFRGGGKASRKVFF